MSQIHELETEADRRKLQFEATIVQIRQRVSPERIVDDAVQMLEVPGIRAAEALKGAARRNPVLFGMLAGAAGWLFLRILPRQRGVKRNRSHHKRAKELGYGNSHK
jgi:hypothetical protein